MPSKALCQSAQWPPRKSAAEASNAPVNGVHPESLRYERLLDEADFLLELQAETPNDAQTDLLKENYALLRDAFREVKDAELVNQIKDRMKRVTSLLMKMSDLKSKSNSSSSVSDIPVNGNHSTERYRPSIATNKVMLLYTIRKREGEREGL